MSAVDPAGGTSFTAISTVTELATACNAANWNSCTGAKYQFSNCVTVDTVYNAATSGGDFGSTAGNAPVVSSTATGVLESFRGRTVVAIDIDGATVTQSQAAIATITELSTACGG